MNDTERDTINRYIHTNIMQMCWHEPVVITPERLESVRCSVCHNSHVAYGEQQHCVCRNCGEHSTSFEADPDYCSSLDAIAKVEAKVIEQIGERRFGMRLNLMLGGLLKAFAEDANLYDRFTAIATLTAEQRATACYNAHRSQQ